MQASSKQQVVEICQDAFKHREKEIPPNHVLKFIADSFNIDFTEASKVIFFNYFFNNIDNKLSINFRFHFT